MRQGATRRRPQVNTPPLGQITVNATITAPDAIVEAGVVRSAGTIETTPERLELFVRTLGRDHRVALKVTAVGASARRGAKTDRLDARPLPGLLWAGELDERPYRPLE